MKKYQTPTIATEYIYGAMYLLKDSGDEQGLGKIGEQPGGGLNNPSMAPQRVF